MSDFTTQILPSLQLVDPFMIASSHWTASDNVFRHLAAVRPAPATLKTVSAVHGGNGKESVGAKRDKGEFFNTFRSRVGYFTDGPKSIELWNVPTAEAMGHLARARLPETVLGLSILYGEDYTSLARQLSKDLYGYVELNWKYTFRDARPLTLNEMVKRVCEDFARFFEAFSGLPPIIKVPHEVLPWIGTDLFDPIVESVRAAAGALLIANSKKVRVPPSRTPNGIERNRGVVIGDYLLPDTFTALKTVTERYHDAVPLIATGGVTDIGAVVDCLGAGAVAVQLCSALDLRGPEVVSWLREQLGQLAKSDLPEFVRAMRADSIALHLATDRAVSLVLDEQDIPKILSDKITKLEIILADAVKRELAQDFATAAHDAEPSVACAFPRHSFIISKGNAGSYLLGMEISSRCHMTPVDMRDAGDFKKAITSQQFQWDFAIVSRSVAEFLQKDSETVLAGNFPEIVATVGNSCFEIVGNASESLDDIDTLYLFEGISSSAALGRLLKERGAGPRIEIITADRLPPLLRFWRDGCAILAKIPLTAIYGLLREPGAQAAWGTQWQTQEDLVLICSRRVLVSDEGRKMSDNVIATAQTVRSSLAGSPEESASGLIRSGFLNHCAKLLGAKAVI